MPVTLCRSCLISGEGEKEGLTGRRKQDISTDISVDIISLLTKNTSEANKNVQKGGERQVIKTEMKQMRRGD